jgi:hypothetical protein
MYLKRWLLNVREIWWTFSLASRGWLYPRLYPGLSATCHVLYLSSIHGYNSRGEQLPEKKRFQKGSEITVERRATNKTRASFRRSDLELTRALLGI